MRRTRVLTVEDSATVRARLRQAIESDQAFELVGEACDGRQAVELCEARRPDVITMDIVLPTMSGLAATEHIMAHTPTPILVVSSSFNRGELFKTYEALAAGAVDVLEKPGIEDDDVWDRRLLSTLRIVSRVPVITHVRGRLAPPVEAPSRPSLPAPHVDGHVPARIVAIGASTGGPGAILAVLRGLPEDFPTPIVFVLHISRQFGSAFADWLAGQTRRKVTLAVPDQRIEDRAGQIVMAPPDVHLVVRNGRLHLSQDQERNFCRPSVDVLFESVAREYGQEAVGCLLTGMGRDGASGLLSIRAAGGMTIAQDEASSVVYGMPREAMLLGAAHKNLPLDEIGPAIALACAGAAIR